MKGAGKSKPAINSVLDSEKADLTTQVPPTDHPISFQTKQFSVILLIDTAERGLFQTGLEFCSLGIDFEVRHLKVGDYAWIARDKDNRELVLPFIVERKRLDDLVHSVRDGRFAEQKFRLKASGIPNIIFIIESYSTKADTRSVPQAISNMLVKDSFTVKETKNNTETVKYLGALTHFLRCSMQGKFLVQGSTFQTESEAGDVDTSLVLPEFNSFFQGLGKVKMYTAKEMFVKQLVQLHGLSADKAWMIASIYKTPKALLEAFQEIGPLLLSEVEYGLNLRKMGTSLSTTLHQFYTTLDFKILE